MASHYKDIVDILRKAFVETKPQHHLKWLKNLASRRFEPRNLRTLSLNQNLIF